MVQCQYPIALVPVPNPESEGIHYFHLLPDERNRNLSCSCLRLESRKILSYSTFNRVPVSQVKRYQVLIVHVRKILSYDSLLISFCFSGKAVAEQDLNSQGAKVTFVPQVIFALLRECSRQRLNRFHFCALGVGPSRFFSHLTTSFRTSGTV